MPIVLDKDEWARINKWTEADKEDPEAKRRREYVNYLGQMSNSMTKDWPNSVENVNKRNEEMRRRRIEAAEQANTVFYKRYLKRQRDQQQRLLHSARDTVFKSKDAPKLLLSAVIESVVQKERAEQVKFQNKLKQMATDKKKKEDEDIIRRAKEWNQMQADRKKKRFEVEKEYQKEIVAQAAEALARSRGEHEAELQMQRLDNLRAREEMDAIKQFEDDFKAKEKAQIWAAMEQARQDREERHQIEAALDKMDDDLLAVLQNTNKRIDHMRKKTEAELKAERLRVLEKISQRLVSGDAERDAKEDAILQKALKEKNESDEARRQALLAKEARFRRQRREAREQFLRDEAQKLRDEHTRQQWDLMNRFKNLEINDEFQEKLRQEKARKIREYRDDLIKLRQERSDREARELAERRHFYGELALQKLRAADNKLLTHGAALVEEARRDGRPDYPIRQAIDRYCKLYRLNPMPDLPKSMKEHFPRYSPWDGTRPDPGYVEPPPPRPDPGPDAPDDEEPAPARDGLQDMAQAGPSKPAKEKEGEDYKRTGRANGLQRKPAETDVSLPPIVVLPYMPAECSCDIKTCAHKTGPKLPPLAACRPAECGCADRLASAAETLARRLCAQ